MNVKLFIHSIISEKFPDAMMHTEKSKELAESRHVFMKSFLQEWEKEQGSNECESCL
jgi:HD superfamily phosphodiesterase